MKMLLTDNGHPFSGSRLVQDLRNASQDVIPRYITLLAVNNDEEPANLTVSLEADALTPFPLFSIDLLSGGPLTVLRRLPLLPGYALHVTAAPSVHCFGWSEVEPILRAQTPSAFFAPPGEPRGVLLSENAEGEPRTEELELHRLAEQVHEVSLVVDMTDNVAGDEEQQVEVRFYDVASAYTTLVVRGPKLAHRLLDGIPMRGPGSVRALWTGTEQCKAFAYGTVIRR